jgi:hypothetical protein
MRNRMLAILVFFFGLVLVLIVFASDRSISKLMERCGELISQALGF